MSHASEIDPSGIRVPRLTAKIRRTGKTFRWSRVVEVAMIHYQSIEMDNDKVGIKARRVAYETTFASRVPKNKKFIRDAPCA